MKLTHPVTSQLGPDPIESGQIISGTPESFALTLGETPGTGESCGLWQITPGVVRDVEVRERSLILAGRGSVEFEDGRRVELEPGVVLDFEGGEKTVWKIDQTVFKAYWIQE